MGCGVTCIGFRSRLILPSMRFARSRQITQAGGICFEPNRSTNPRIFHRQGAAMNTNLSTAWRRRRWVLRLTSRDNCVPFVSSDSAALVFSLPWSRFQLLVSDYRASLLLPPPGCADAGCVFVAGAGALLLLLLSLIRSPENVSVKLFPVLRNNS